MVAPLFRPMTTASSVDELPLDIPRKSISWGKLSLKQLDIVQSLHNPTSEGNDELEDGEIAVDQRMCAVETPEDDSNDLKVDKTVKMDGPIS